MTLSILQMGKLNPIEIKLTKDTEPVNDRARFRMKDWLTPKSTFFQLK